ncbi:MAG TPA: amino acid permease, partial [Candidatus Krumholzibacteria bacterium]|nr:amino acid permease [Candidatus Krumholzibacteria bacterium]
AHPQTGPPQVARTMAVTDTGLRRVLGSASATAVVIGAIVGAGIFFTPTLVARMTGDASLAMWTWVAGGLVAMLGALTFAELGGMYPDTAGQYEILRDAFAPWVGFCFVVCNATAIVAAGTAIISIVCAENIAAIVGTLASPSRVTLTAVVVLAAAAGANMVGVRWGAAIQNTTVMAKIVTLLLIAALAVFLAPASPPVAREAAGEAARGPAGLRLFAGLVPTLFAYGGWQYALWVGGEVKNPRRNVPLAIVGGVAVVVVVYTVVNWAYLKLLGFDGVAGSDALAADAVSVVWPGAGSRLIALAVALSAFGVLNVQILSGPRLLYGMARDGRFFSVFGRTHPRFATPAIAIAFVAAISASLILAAGKGGIDKLLTGLVLIDAVFFGLTGLALIVLRKKRPDADRPVRTPLYPIVPILFLMFECLIIYGAFRLGAAAAWIGVLWIAAASACYALFFRKRAAA